MSNVDDAFLVAQSLDPADKIQLIGRLWETLPPAKGFRPSEGDLTEVKRRWAEYETGREKAIPWEHVWDEIERETAKDA